MEASSQVKRVAVITSGGDAPGMNAAVRAITLAAHYYKLEVIGFRHGYHGILENDWTVLNPRRVQHIIHRGGTILKSARSSRFATEEGGRFAAQRLNDLAIDALLVIGGDGSFHGALHLSQFWQGQIVGLPGTIDNDIAGTDFSIGFHTAVETALDAIDKIRDTADAFERVFVIEVMGRHAGFIALHSALGSGCEEILVPEVFSTPEQEFPQILNKISHNQKTQGESHIIILAEHLWPGGASALANEIDNVLEHVECRPLILGHIQRGGSPVGPDRLLATKLGAFAVEQIVEGAHCHMVGEQSNQLVTHPFAHCWESQKDLDPYLVHLKKELFNLNKFG